MSSWIFQGNPDTFDIDGYLRILPSRFAWLVTRYADQIAVGDRIFLWRNKGKARTISGIVAEAVVVETVELRPETAEAKPFWRDGAKAANELRPRVLLDLRHVASAREVIKEDWLRADPILQDLPNLKFHSATNYPVEERFEQRLTALWARTGRDWSRDEVVAALWAYTETYSAKVSKLAASPVADVALRIGRPVTGVYNKLMNLRAIDPRDDRAGFKGGAAMDRAVWSEFFDVGTGGLDAAAISAEYQRLWIEPDEKSEVDERTEREHVEEAAQEFQRKSLEELLDRYARTRSGSDQKPRPRRARSTVYERDPLVVAIARARSGFRCEVPGCRSELFLTPDGTPYTEVHHIRSLADGGDDTIENVACVCVSHHREVHLGMGRKALDAVLRAVRAGDQTGDRRSA